jgi:hypothetical protein
MKILAVDKPEIAYAAGLFEGEGCITVSRGRARLVISMTDKEPLQRVHAILGGSIRGPYGPYTGNRKPHWQWMIERGDLVKEAYGLMEPWLSSRRQQRFQEVLPHISPHGSGGAAQRAKTHCPRGHAYDKENTRINRTGSRSCRACHRAYMRVWSRAKRAEQFAS